MDAENESYLIPYKVYRVLLWIALVVCPAVATFIGVIAPAWGFSCEAIITTITAFGTLLGALLKYSEYTGKDNEANNGC